MFNGMMDPELLKLAQEQMSKIPPEELAKMQQQMMSNPDLIKMASESMKNMKTEDFKRAAAQMKHTRPEDMAEISERMSRAKPEEIAAMKAHADAQMSYELSGAKLLKQQGNELHSRGQFQDASEKYKRAKDNLKDILSSEARTLQIQCSLNLMSCYLRIGRYNECVDEGTEVLSIDSNNVKALYRRGQAYRELANYEAALVDLEKANQISPDDETIANVYSEVKEKCGSKRRTVSKGVIIEEIDDDEEEEEKVEEKPESSSKDQWRSPVETSVNPPSENTASAHLADTPISTEHLRSLGEDPASIRLFQNYVSNTDPETLSRLGSQQGMPTDMLKTATDMIKTMKPEELQKMFQVASALNQSGPSGLSPIPNLGPNMPDMSQMSPDMMKMASDTISKMPPEELQRMMSLASSSFGGANNNNNNNNNSNNNNESNVSARTERQTQSSSVPSASSFAESSSFPTNLASPVDLQAARNQLNDPAMRQMMTSMMRNMDPEMMANMSQQFGMKLSKEDATKAQQAIASFSPENLDRMMKWADKALKGAEVAKKTKNWLMGRQGMMLAVVVIIIAFVLHQFGFIGA